MVNQVRVVLLGHVDHGKSTLIGRLFHDTGAMPEGKYEQLIERARRRGTGVELANLMDSLQAERDQNVTIDTAQIWFNNKGRQYVFIDAPGHREFLKNMITGAARADAAIVVVDAAEGVQEQSRCHGSFARLLGIDQVLVVINKMDLVEYEQATFERVSRDYTAFLSDVGVTPLGVVPISARYGENVAQPGHRMAWFEGPTLLDALAWFAAPVAQSQKALRLPIQAVYRFDHRRIVVGRIESGTLGVGDDLVFLPSGKESRVRSIERWNRAPTESASAGDSVGLTLTEELFLERGEVASPVTDAPAVTREIRARVFWLGREALATGRPYRLKLTTQEVDCEVGEVHQVIDASTLEGRNGPSVVGRHEVADVTIRTRRPIAVDRYGDMPATGRFVLVDSLEISGGGIVSDASVAEPLIRIQSEALLVRSLGQVEREEREIRNGHRGAVVWFTGLSGSGKSTLANALERELFDRGMQVFVLDGDNVRLGLSADLGFSSGERAENIRRVAEVAKLFAEAGVIAVTALISPYRSDRLRARQIMREGGLSIPFLEVYLDVPMAVCAERDPKGLYAKARSGEIRKFTGVSDPYEPPEAPELILRTAERTIEECRTALLDHLLPAVTLRMRRHQESR